MRDKTTAALLAFFLGGIGGQYFYLNRVGAGIVCLLFSWTFIPLLISIYHTIKFLCMSQESFNWEYNREYMQMRQHSFMMASMQQAQRQPAVVASSPLALPESVTYAEVVSVSEAKATVNISDELERLFQLKQKGALTEEEYLVRKAKLLA